MKGNANELNDYQHWLLNHLRKKGYTVVVADPSNKLICGTRGDVALLDELTKEDAANDDVSCA